MTGTVANSTGTVVTSLTVAALAVIGVLTFQASANAPDGPVPSRPDSSSSPAKHKGKKGAESTAIPKDSGTGVRVVYALQARRVWLVGADEQPKRTFKVTPSSVSPTPGSYRVTSRSSSITGSDGVPIENVVVFDTDKDVVFGFSAAVNGSKPNPDASKRTGGIRERRDDGAALWNFASMQTRVVVVP